MKKKCVLMTAYFVIYGYAMITILTTHRTPAVALLLLLATLVFIVNDEEKKEDNQKTKTSQDIVSEVLKKELNFLADETIDRTATTIVKELQLEDIQKKGDKISEKNN